MIINHLKIPVILLVALFAISSPVMAKKNNKCLEVYEEQNIALCTKLAEQGDANAQNTLGKIYYANALNVRGYHTKARILFEKAAAQGLADAQYNLGAIYRDEFNNFPVALTWFEKAAAQNHAGAQNSIGYIYENGYGGEKPRDYIFDENGKNIDPRIPEYEKQTWPKEYLIPKESRPRSIYPMGEFGQGIEQDLPKALEWYNKAADQGHALARTNLAFLYLMGLGTEQDDKKAFELYQKAAAQDFIPAMRTLAFMYIQGLGTEKNVPEGFAILVKTYQLSPSVYTEDGLNRLKRKKEYLHYKLSYTPISYKDDPYYERFKLENSSEEDFLHDENSYRKQFYQLTFNGGHNMGTMIGYMRPTLNLVRGKYAQNEVLEERILLKYAIQSHSDYMHKLSWFYYEIDREKGIKVQDMERAILWKNYALNMGEMDRVEYWPGYYESVGIL